MGKILIPDTIAVRYFRDSVEGVEPCNGKYKGRCPVCGDSQKSKRLKRMYLLNHRDRGWLVYCHNCEASMSFWNFIKYYFPAKFEYLKQETFSSYYNEQLRPVSAGPIDDKALFLDALQAFRAKKESEPAIQRFLNTCCFRITDANLDDKNKKIAKCIIKKMEARMLKQEIVNDLWFCYRNDYKNKWCYKNRVIIPFFDNDRQIYYFQARTLLKDQSPKYINWKEGDDEVAKPQYNECFIDKSKPVYIIEGLIDSTFVDNSVSLLGVKMSDDKMFELEEKYGQCIFVLDNDLDGHKYTYKLLKRNKKCFIWPKQYKNVKDLNDLALLLKEQNLTKIIEASCYNGVQGLMKLAELQGKC